MLDLKMGRVRSQMEKNQADSVRSKEGKEAGNWRK